MKEKKLKILVFFLAFYPIAVTKKYYEKIPAEFLNDHYTIPTKYFYCTVAELNKNASENQKVFFSF